MVSCIESATGVQAGGRTGLTGVTTAACFLLALFLTPVILMIPPVAVAPALVVVGILMFESVSEIKVHHFESAAPAILTLLFMPMTFSISTGIGVGIITLVVLRLGLWPGRKQQAAPMDGPHLGFDAGPADGGAGEARRGLSPVTYILAVIFVLHFLERWIFQLLSHRS